MAGGVVAGMADELEVGTMSLKVLVVGGATVESTTGFPVVGGRDRVAEVVARVMVVAATGNAQTGPLDGLFEF